MGVLFGFWVCWSQEESLDTQVTNTLVGHSRTLSQCVRDTSVSKTDP